MKYNYTEDDINTIAEEAFMAGRIYAAGGEKETPVEIHKKLRENITKALKRQIDRSNSEVNVERLVIKPCPFCGSKKIRVWEKGGYWAIQCDDVDAVCAAMLYDHESKEMVIEHWNKRVL